MSRTSLFRRLRRIVGLPVAPKGREDYLTERELHQLLGFLVAVAVLTGEDDTEAHQAQEGKHRAR